MSDAADIAVAAADDWLSGLVARRSGLFVGLGDLESRVLDRSLAALAIDRPIYIAGLARAGTTILLELLTQHPDVATHRYRDFPMLFTPVWWNRFLDRASRVDSAPMERAHKDRIAVTRDSPEAMEEVLWMHFFPDCHDPAAVNVLDAGLERPDFARFYRRHIQKILLLRGGRRYLAKGNYNLTRLGYLRQLFPDARFLIPVRDPIGHIASLMKQQRLFARLETDDERVLNYMRRAGHFEFGLDRRPINTGGSVAEDVARLWQAGDEVRGWARYWAALYHYVARALAGDAELRAATRVVHYTALCAQPAEILGDVYAHCALPVDPATLAVQAARLSHPDYYRPPFDSGELAVIAEETADADAAIRRLCQPPVGGAAVAGR